MSVLFASDNVTDMDHPYQMISTGKWWRARGAFQTNEKMFCIRYLYFIYRHCRWCYMHFGGPKSLSLLHHVSDYMGRVKRIWYLSPMRAAKAQASLRMRAVSPESPLLAHTTPCNFLPLSEIFAFVL